MRMLNSAEQVSRIFSKEIFFFLSGVSAKIYQVHKWKEKADKKLFRQSQEQKVSTWKTQQNEKVSTIFESLYCSGV